MVRGHLAWLAGLGATLALVAGACTKSNTAYCAEADHFLCSALVDAGPDLAEELGADGDDVAEAMPDQKRNDAADAAETAADAVDAGDGGDAADVVPACTGNPSCAGDPAGKTICDPTTHMCRGCRIDDECTAADEAGVCLAARCVPKSDVILVDSAFNPCVPVSATIGARMCDMAGALMQARADGERRRIIVVANDQGPWTHALVLPDNPRVTVVGRKTAHFKASSASPAITLTSSVDVVLRGIQVEGDIAQMKPGIVVNAGAIASLEQVRVSNGTIGVQDDGAGRITIERSWLLGNGVGLSLNGAEFTVRNTVIADSTSIGAKLAVPLVAGKTMRFQNNTLIKNQMPLICSAAMTTSALLISPFFAGALPCAPPNTVNDTMDPMFEPALPGEPAYHLTAASPCHNAGDTVEFPELDIDGDPRPMGGRSDCGADEFRE